MANKERTIDMLDRLSGDDPEMAHSKADEYLLAFLRDIGHEDVADAYELVMLRCPWWATA